MGQIGNGNAFLTSISTTGILAEFSNGGLGGLIGAIRTGYQGEDNDKKYSFLGTDNLNIGPTFDRDSQNPTVGEDIQPRNLLANIFHLLDDNRCSTFVSNMINVARQMTGLKPYTYDGKELAIAVANQENGGYIFRPGADGGGGGGSAYGDIFSGGATAQLIMFNTAYGPRDPVGVHVSYALTALHEDYTSGGRGRQRQRRISRLLHGCDSGSRCVHSHQCARLPWGLRP